MVSITRISAISSRENVTGVRRESSDIGPSTTYPIAKVASFLVVAIAAKRAGAGQRRPFFLVVFFFATTARARWKSLSRLSRIFSRFRAVFR